MSEELNQLMLKIKDEVSSVVEQHLLPYFERMKTNNENIRLIESVLRQMPDFQRLEKENAELKEALANKVIPPQPQAPQPQAPQPIAPQPIAPGPVQIVENIIKLEIVETTRSETSEVLESDLYKVVSLANNMVNVQVGKEEEESEEEEEAEASEAEASEEEAEEEEASEAEASEAEEAEEEASEAEASEAEEEEEEEEEEEDGVEGAEPLEEEDEAEPLAEPLEDTIQDTGVEGGDPLEEEVTIIDIKDHGKFYTSNPVNGDIYKIDTDEEVGEQVGKFVNSFPIFF
jgi:hypothetical protein